MAARTDHRFTPTHVVRTLWPHQPGAKALARQFGRRLVCVRHRHNASGLHRYVTVELIVAEGPVSTLRHDQALFACRIDPGRPSVVQRAKQLGGRYDRGLKRWIVTGEVARQLRLTSSAIKLPVGRAYEGNGY